MAVTLPTTYGRFMGIVIRHDEIFFLVGRISDWKSVFVRKGGEEKKKNLPVHMDVSLFLFLWVAGRLILQLRRHR
jgi:hypothetical protein